MKGKKLLTVGLAALMMFGASGCASEQQDAVERIKEQGYIVLGTSPDYAPNEFYIDDNGTKKIVGSDIALAQAVADKLGVGVEDLADCAVMKDLREDLNIGTTQSRPNAGVGIQTKFRIADILGISINCVEKFKREAGI